MKRFDLVVTRHSGLVEYFLQEGMITEGIPVVAHVSIKQVLNKHVLGVLPLVLAVHAASVTEVPLALGPADQGKELSAARVRELAGFPVTYKVTFV